VILPGNWAPKLEGLAKLDRLVRFTLVLDRSREPISLAPLRELAPSLRELRFANRIDPAVLVDLLRVLGPRLERLSLAQILDRAEREAIEPLVAGELREGDLDLPRALLGRSPLPMLVNREQPTYRAEPAFVLCSTGDIRQMFGSEIFIGRGDHDELLIDGSWVVFRRTAIRRDGDHFSVEDIGDAGWTFVNDARVARAELRDGDTIGAAREVFRFYCGPGALERARASRR
jgi:hypothetical protein